MERIADVIKQRAEHHHLGASAKASEVIFQANRLIAKHLSEPDKELRAFRLSDGVLWVSVPHAAWAQELWGIADPILRELQLRFGKKIIRKIRTKA